MPRRRRSRVSSAARAGTGRGRWRTSPRPRRRRSPRPAPRSIRGPSARRQGGPGRPGAPPPCPRRRGRSWCRCSSSAPYRRT
ncbi:MAG: hypothetical protein EKK62_06690 [Acidimicrobiia bacterium]|nr:MAG: hypothetical protein EKK62_06690 [Acidimicrobiia bacterium]